MRRLLDRALSIAAEAGDDDDLLLRKRVAVIAGYVTIGAALILPILGDWTLLTVVGTLAITAAMAVNLASSPARADSTGTSA